MGLREDNATAPSEASTRTSKDDWLNLAIEALVSEGIDQVKVQVMAKKLGVSRSSFYWMFESIQELQDQLLDYWLRKNTGPIIERAMRPAATINRAICNVFECWIDGNLYDPNLDTAVRFWARRDPRVRAVVDQADTQRVEALTRMFARYDFDEEEAFTRARVLYFTQVGHYTLDVQDSVTTRMSHLRSYLLTFTGIEPSDADMSTYRKYVSQFEGQTATQARPKSGGG